MKNILKNSLKRLTHIDLKSDKLMRNVSIFLYLIGFYLILQTLLRGILLFHPITQLDSSALDVILVFLKGFARDLSIFIPLLIFLALFLLGIFKEKYKKPYDYVCLVLFIIAGLSLTQARFIKDYNSDAWLGVWIFYGLKLFGFLLCWKIPVLRKAWRLFHYHFLVWLYVFVMIFNAVGEFFFWNEFGVRYNFIAVDYLIYTHEVIGNIVESYPVVPIFIAMGLVSFGVSFFMANKTKNLVLKPQSIIRQAYGFSAYALTLLVVPVLPFINKEDINQKNVFDKELSSNGLYSFYNAFFANRLDYDVFYKTIPNKEAFSLINKILNANLNQQSTLRRVMNSNDIQKSKKNVVYITLESISGRYMARFGNKDKITPFLDSLAEKSLSFDALYATGTRTVRGLEAVTLSLPPTPGRSVVKREENKDLFSLGAILRDNGYTTTYYYGGYSYFDNMKAFFSNNGYRIIDRSNIPQDSIHFENIWGVADEDLYDKAISTLRHHPKDKPFFAHIMSVSNHRPFTYPDGRIDISPKIKSREGGVKYTDYALARFFNQAKKEAWFKNTIFVILSDHCASSAGKELLPIEKYHIPGVVYYDGVDAQKFNKRMSQIDIPTTLLAMLGINYESLFYGQNVLDKNYVPRALIGNYQNLGYWKGDVMSILMPSKKTAQYRVEKEVIQENSIIENEKNQITIYHNLPLNQENTTLLNEAIAYYQTASDQLKRGIYKSKGVGK